MASSTTSSARKLATGLGVVSLGLGLTEALAPGRITKLVGAQGANHSIVRALGVREIGHGAAILLGSPQLVWTRVAGDVLDLAVWARAAAKYPRARGRRGALIAVGLAGISAADAYAAVRTNRVT